MKLHNCVIVLAFLSVGCNAALDLSNLDPEDTTVVPAGTTVVSSGSKFDRSSAALHPTDRKASTMTQLWSFMLIPLGSSAELRGTRAWERGLRVTCPGRIQL